MTNQAMTGQEIRDMQATDATILQAAEEYVWTKEDLNILLQEIEECADDVNYVTYLNKIIASL